MSMLITNIAILVLIHIAKSIQFSLHIWLLGAMGGAAPILAFIYAASIVVTRIFLVTRLLPLFIVILYIMNGISFTSIITILLGVTLALAQKYIKRSLAYPTISQFRYMMLALGIGSYRAALFHFITHDHSNVLWFLGSNFVIHSMEAMIGYSLDKSQDMVLRRGLTKHLPITKTAFLIGTLSLRVTMPLACLLSNDEILNASW
ncbi:hypothetical protein Cgig2_001554 [Carnegiea gigantea]|uniref:NADH:quinone oxidoreductase/Mrp antiporter transmembrane domain-containing protein n=1 Tax=Carnegiea gigantea TaxID=171969 RepID=A0A9Q1JZW5_9CARY|nr:hypothetical protein Cgig2_001554 [Carnegiea gigantea]